MKLLLTSGGLCNSSILSAARELVGRPTTELRFVYIPTAMHPERGDKTWALNNMKAAHDMGWRQFDIIDIAAVASLPKDMWLPDLQRADVIMVGGGNCFYLSYWLQRAGLMERLGEFIKNKVYIGSSAGSMVLTPLQLVDAELEKQGILRDTEYDEQGPEGESSKVMAGVVNFALRPHLNQDDFPKIRLGNVQQVAKTLGMPLYALDDQSALKVVDGKVEVISEGIWKLFQD